VTKYMNVAPWGIYFFTYSMNQAKWNSLPKDIQEIITKMNDEENARRLSRDWGAKAAEELDQLIKGKVEKYVMPNRS